MYAGNVGQSIERPVGINVFGSCLLGADPDYAAVRCRVGHLAETPAPAFQGTRAQLTAARRVFLEGQVAAPDLQISRIGLEPAYEGPYDEKRFVGYAGRAELVVLVRELSGLEELLQQAVEIGAFIEDVGYMTTQLVELRQRARAGAVEAARRKAEAYAAAAHVRVGALIHLEDVNPEQLGRRSHVPDIDLTETSDADTVTGSIRIAGAVMACFAILGGA